MTVELPDDLELLRTLHVLLTERHVTRAARKLGMTQSAASQRLSRLRSHFRDDLLVAGRPLMVLTARGRALVSPLGDALATLRTAMLKGAEFAAATATRRFTLLGNDLVETLAVPALLAATATRAPGIDWSIERVDQDYVARLEAGTADLAFVPSFLEVESLRRRALKPQPFEVMLRAGHPLARRATISLERYLDASHILIAPRGAPGSLVDSLLARLGHTRRVRVRVQHFTSAAWVAARSDLIVTCPAHVRHAVSRELALVHRAPPVELEPDRSSVVWHERVHEDPGHRWVRELIFSELGNAGVE